MGIGGLPRVVRRRRHDRPCNAGERPSPTAKVVNENWGWVFSPSHQPALSLAGWADGARPFSLSSYGTLVPCAFQGSEAMHLKSQGATYAVIWHPWSGCDPGAADWLQSPWSSPWRLACDPRDSRQRVECPDHPMWDLSRFDDTYWRQLAAVVAAADEPSGEAAHRLLVRIHLFARQEFDAGRVHNPSRAATT